MHVYCINIGLIINLHDIVISGRSIYTRKYGIDILL